MAGVYIEHRTGLDLRIKCPHAVLARLKAHRHILSSGCFEFPPFIDLFTMRLWFIFYQ